MNTTLRISILHIVLLLLVLTMPTLFSPIAHADENLKPLVDLYKGSRCLEYLWGSGAEQGNAALGGGTRVQLFDVNSGALILDFNNSPSHPFAYSSGYHAFRIPASAIPGGITHGRRFRVYGIDGDHSNSNNTDQFGKCATGGTGGHGVCETAVIGTKAREVLRMDCGAVPTATPRPPTPVIPTSTPRPTTRPTITPIGTRTPTRIPTGTVMPTLTLTTTPTSAPTATPTPSPTVTQTLTPTLTLTPTPAPRYGECDSCGYCLRRDPPESWSACAQCMYPDLITETTLATENKTLLIDTTTNKAPIPSKGRYFTQLGCINLGGSSFSDPGAAGGVLDFLLNNFMFPIVGVLGILGIIYGSFLVMRSQDDPEQLNRGKKWVYGSIIGVIFTLGSVLLIQMIGGDILKIPGFTR